MYPRFSFLLLFLFFISCTKSESFVTTEKELSVTPLIGEISKSIVDDNNIKERSVGIHITDLSGTFVYDNYSDYNINRLYYDSGWKCDDGNGNLRKIILTSQNAKIFGFYPSTLSLTGTGQSSAVTLDISRERNYSDMTDYLWCSQSTTFPGGSLPINAVNANVYLQMNHAMTILAFIIYKDGYTGSAILSKVEMIDNSVLPSLRANNSPINNLNMKLTDGSISGGELVSSLTVNNINSQITLSADPGSNPDILFTNKNCHILFAPVTLSDRSKLEFSFNIDGVSYYASLAGNDPITFNPGQIYVFKAKLSPKMLKITGVIDWKVVNYDIISGI